MRQIKGDTPSERFANMTEKEQDSAVAFFIGLGIAVIALIVWLWPEGEQEAPPPPPPIGAQQRNAVENVAMMTALDALKSPSSASFVPGTTKITQIGPHSWEVGGQVDAENSFGAQTRNIWMVRLQAKETCDNYRNSSCWTVTTGPIIMAR